MSEEERKLLVEAVRALGELGVALADEHHEWTPEQRKAWETADRKLRQAGARIAGGGK